MDFDIYAAATYGLPSAKIATTNPVVATAFDQKAVASGPDQELAVLKTALDMAVAELSKATGEEPSKLKQRLMAAQAMDAAVAGSE